LNLSGPVLAASRIKTISVNINSNENILFLHRLKEVTFWLAIVSLNWMSVNFPSIIDKVNHKDFKTHHEFL
jgi:hypothetical protein